MRPYTGIKPESLPKPDAPDFHSRLRGMVEYLDYWARDASFGFNRIMLSQVPDGSGNTIGDGGTLTDYFYLPGRSGGQVGHGGTGSGDVLTLKGNSVATVNGWVRIPIFTPSTSATPDTNEILKIQTSDDVNIFNVQGDGATTIAAPYTTYTSGNPILLTLQMDDATTSPSTIFRIRTQSANVFTVSYTGGTAIDMATNNIAFSVDQASGASADFARFTGSTGTLLGVDSNGDIYGGSLTSSTLVLYSDNLFDSGTGMVELTATPTFQIRSGATGNTYVPYSFGIGTVGGSTFTGNNVAFLLTATSGGATAGYPSLTINNTNATHASIATVLYKAIRKSGQTGDLFQFLDSDSSTKLSYVDASGAWNGPIASATGLSTFDHILIDNATASDVLLKMVPHASQSVDIFQLRNSGDTASLINITSAGVLTLTAPSDTTMFRVTGFAGAVGQLVEFENSAGVRMFALDASGTVTVSDTSHTDDFVRLQVRAPSTQASANIFQIVRAYAGGNYTGLQCGFDGRMISGDNTAHGAAVVKLQLRQGSGQSVNMFEVVNTAGTASLFTINSGGHVVDSQFTVADNADATKRFAFQASGITTATTRTYTVPNATTTLAGLGVAAQTWTGTHVVTGGSSGFTFEIAPANDIGCLALTAASLPTTDNILTCRDADGSVYLRVGANTPFVNMTTMAIWPSGVGVGFRGSFSFDTLTADRTATFPNASGTVVLTSVFNLNNRTTNIGPVTIVNSGTTGTYLINWYAVVETAASSGPSTATLSVTYVDSGGVTRTAEVVGVLDTTTLNNKQTGALTINSDGSVAATYSLTFTTASGTPSIDSNLSVTRV